MTREQLVSIVKRSLEHRATGTQDQADGVLEVPVANYIDPERWALEMEQVFRRLPVVVAASCELRAPHSYIAGEFAGTPYLVSRGDDGELRAFYNMCSHRGAPVAEPGVGAARRHTCRYHGWSYDGDGRLVGVLDAGDVGIDKSCYGLTPLACAERAGLVWIWLTDEPLVDIDTFLCGYGEVLALLDLEHCHAVGRQSIAGPNWKIAYDGYLDFYHLPILHRDTFGPQMSSKAMYDAWGPHQKVSSPNQGNERFVDVPEEEWRTKQLLDGVFTIFPHVSIARFDAKGSVWMVSLLSPGDDPGSSITTQLFLHTREPSDEQAEVMREVMAFNQHVVRDEDYSMGLQVQRALHSGGKAVNLFGRNEGGGQRFHTFLGELLDTPDDELATFLKRSAGDAGDRPA